MNPNDPQTPGQGGGEPTGPSGPPGGQPSTPGGPTPQPGTPLEPTTPPAGAPPAPGGTPTPGPQPGAPGGEQPGGPTPTGGGEPGGPTEGPSQETPGEGSSEPSPSQRLSEPEAIAPPPKENQPWDVIIIGSGPAGFTAAIYTTRAALSTLVIGGTRWGGQLQLTTEVENYPGFRSILGPDLMTKMKEHATAFGAEFVTQDVEKVDFRNHPFTVGVEPEATRPSEYKAKSVIIASGAETRWLGLESEQKYIGRGVSSCAPCDAPFFRGKRVIVVGGGDSAMEEASVLTKYAASVAIVHRREEFRASQAMQQRVLGNAKIKVLWNSAIEEVLGNDKVTGVRLKNLKTEELSEMPIDGMFVAIGHTPMTKLYGDQIELDKKGYVVVHDHTRTNIPGVYVAGDVHDWHYRQAVTAAGFGCMAAMDLEKWLESEKAEDGGPKADSGG